MRRPVRVGLGAAASRERAMPNARRAEHGTAYGRRESALRGSVECADVRAVGSAPSRDRRRAFRRRRQTRSGVSDGGFCTPQKRARHGLSSGYSVSSRRCARAHQRLRATSSSRSSGASSSPRARVSLAFIACARARHGLRGDGTRTSKRTVARARAAQNPRRVSRRSRAHARALPFVRYAREDSTISSS